jgi:RHS repeat-associated protein
MGVLAQKDPSGAWEWMLEDGLGSVRSVINNALSVLEHRHYEPYGNLYAGAMAETPFGFTGEWRDGATGMYYLRARYYNPAMGAFVSQDVLETPNRYAYVGGNVVNRVDPSGKCWVNNSSSPNQQAQCADAWRGYTNLITNTYTQNWPRDVRVLASQEALYWGNLSYGNFASQWNSSRSPASSDPGGQIWQSSLSILGGLSFANPAPGPEDLIFLGGLCIAGIWAIAASAGAITLPLRQAYNFSEAVSEEDDVAIPIPIPYERRRDEGDETWFHYTDEPGITEIAATGIIRANSANVVYVTRELYGRDEVFYALFAGNPAYQGKGDFYAEFVAQEGVVFLPAGAAPEATQANEWVHYGSLRLGRHIRYFVYLGLNQF